MTVILVLLSLVLPAVAVTTGWIVERFQRKVAELELGFWDTNVLAAIHGGAVQ